MPPGPRGTPKEMKKLGSYVSDKDYTVLGIRPSGHATLAYDMDRVRWEDWLVDYPVYPTRAIIELWDLIQELQKSLPVVIVPALLVHARSDTGGGNFDPNSMKLIYDHLGTTNKEMHWVDISGHNVLEDQARKEVFEYINEFILRVTTTSL